MTKRERYELLLPQLASLIEGEKDLVAVLSNFVALLHEEMGFFWTGFYRVESEELVVGPFQGPVACFRIRKGRGVCGAAWEKGETIVAPDVEQFPGHIACSSFSRSEIVVPVFDVTGTVAAVLDIDSCELNTFDETDRKYLERAVSLLSPYFSSPC